MDGFVLIGRGEEQNQRQRSDSGYEEAHMLCGAGGGVGESAEGWDGGGGGGGVEANLGER